MQFSLRARIISISLMATPLLVGLSPAVAHAGELTPASNILIAKKPQLETLTAEEQAALDCVSQGKPGCDMAAYNRAKQKLKTNEKYNGDRNKQKRRK